MRKKSQPAGAQREKELRRLNRAELLELLLEQSRENDKLKAALRAARERLAKRDIAVSESGSIAEAALKLSGIFEAAQIAADMYLENVKKAGGKADDEKA